MQGYRGKQIKKIASDYKKSQTIFPSSLFDDDILILAPLFLERHCAYMGRPHLVMAPEVLTVLLHYTWPGMIKALPRQDRAAARDSLANTLATRLAPAQTLLTDIMQGRVARAATKQDVSDLMLRITYRTFHTCKN